jgi:hypothetical protein
VLHATALLLILLVGGCDRASRGGPFEPKQSVPDEPLATQPTGGGLTLAGLSLPYSASANTALGALFDITQQGAGGGGAFRVSNANSGAPALVAVSAGYAYTLNVLSLGAGRGGLFRISNASNSKAAVEAETAGSGHAVYGLNTGTGRAGTFEVNNTSSGAEALRGQTTGSGIGVAGVAFGGGRAGVFQIANASNSSAALHTQTNGSGAALLVTHLGASGPIALFQSGGANRIRFNKAGKGFFNGGTQVGGADVAEAFEVEGRVREYEPGDVLMISGRSDRRVARSDEPYSTRVIGVYATRPGILLTERGIDDDFGDTVPVGVVGVIPTKVSAENGTIRRGDLLVASGIRGHAMRADPERLGFGMVIGKALEEFAGPGTGLIEVMVNVK